MKCAFVVLSSVRLIPLIALMLLSSNRSTIYADLDRWRSTYHFRKRRNLMEWILLFVYCMTWMPEYRNVFYLRTGIPGKLLSIFCRPKSSLYLGAMNAASIGPGLFILHGDGTFVTADKIGEKCWICQHVVIGYTNDTDIPSIGNHVTIHAGAKVLGKVRVGDNAIIGANSVVVDDIPPNVTVMGVPARIIWKKELPSRDRDPAIGS